jgi:hypothetical protein
MLVVSEVVPGSTAAVKETDGLQEYAVLRKIGNIKIGKKDTAKVRDMLEAPRPRNEPLQLEFAVPVFEDDEPKTPEKRTARAAATAKQSMELGTLLSVPNLITSIDEMGEAEEQETPRPSGMPSPRPPTPALTALLSQLGIEHLYDALAQEGCYSLEDLRVLHGMQGALYVQPPKHYSWHTSPCLINVISFRVSCAGRALGSDLSNCVGLPLPSARSNQKAVRLPMSPLRRRSRRAQQQASTCTPIHPPSYRYQRPMRWDIPLATLDQLLA